MAGLGVQVKGKRLSKLESEEQASSRWVNRRWMAWITFLFDHIMVLYIILTSPDIGGYENLLSSFLILSGTIIGAYIGFSTWDDVQKKKEEADIVKEVVKSDAVDNAEAFAVTGQDEQDER